MKILLLILSATYPKTGQSTVIIKAKIAYIICFNYQKRLIFNYYDFSSLHNIIAESCPNDLAEVGMERRHSEVSHEVKESKHPEFYS